jgi:hypothetical protein
MIPIEISDSPSIRQDFRDEEWVKEGDQIQGSLRVRGRDEPTPNPTHYMRARSVVRVEVKPASSDRFRRCD